MFFGLKSRIVKADEDSMWNTPHHKVKNGVPPSTMLTLIKQ